MDIFSHPGSMLASPRPSLLIHCQYVYGIGHFVRAVELARSLRQFFDVHLVAGGEPIPNFTLPQDVTFTQLPAVFRDEATGSLLCVDVTLSLATCFDQRARILERIVRTRPPDIVVTEHFPFGLLFEVEVVAMLKHVRRMKPHAMLVSSVRDVIDGAGGGSGDANICALLAAWFDLVLVHGDPRVIHLRSSFPMIDRVTVPCVYTGYVVEPPELRRPRSGPPLLVGAIGGGRVGQELLSALVAAHHELATFWDHELLLFRGAFACEASDVPAGPGLHVRPFDRAAYRQALAQAAGVICLGGYNSVLETLSMSLPTLVYKRKFLGANREQALRAEFFRQSGLIQTIEEEELSPAVLAQRMALHFSAQAKTSPNIDFHGAANACRILLDRWRVHLAAGVHWRPASRFGDADAQFQTPINH